MPASLPLPASSPVHVIGASGRSGLALVASLVASGIRVVPVVRDAGRWQAAWSASRPDAGLVLPYRLADLRDRTALTRALADAVRIVCTAHARHAGAVLDAAPADARFVFLGSTRKFTRWPDAHGNGVLAGEDAFRRSGRPGVMLHPTMIYGAEGENNVQRLAGLLRRLPFVPLPGGGRALVQPIHQSDLTRSIVAALGLHWNGPEALVVAGPDALSYHDFVRAVAQAAGLRARAILPLPAMLLMAAAGPARLIPGLPRIGPDEIRRLLEDKAFDITAMRERLGVNPLTLHEGLVRTFEKVRPS